MPIYEFACPQCRRIFSFLSKRVNPRHSPVCPQCGHKKLVKQISRFTLTKGLAEPVAKSEADPDGPATVIYKTIARRIAVKIAEKAKDHTSKFPSIKVQNT